MKKLIILLTFVLAANIALAEDPVDFPDAELEAAVRFYLEIPDDPIYPSDMLLLTKLTATYTGISNLTGLEYAHNLTELHIDRSQVVDISPLSGLTNLTELWLYGNNIIDITPVSNLTNLNGVGGNCCCFTTIFGNVLDNYLNKENEPFRLAPKLIMLDLV